jgi:hypothetical protein
VAARSGGEGSRWIGRGRESPRRGKGRRLAAGLADATEERGCNGEAGAVSPRVAGRGGGAVGRSWEEHDSVFFYLSSFIKEDSISISFFIFI